MAQKINKNRGILKAVIVAVLLCCALISMYQITQSSASEMPVVEATKVPQKEKATLLFVGDLMVHAPQIEAAKNGKGYEFSPSFEFVKQKISAADLAVGNLETTLSGEERRFTGYPCFNSPDEFADAIKDAGFDVLTTVNNHSMDRHFQGVKRTVEQLDKRQIGHLGTYANEQDRNSVFVRNVNGIKVAFVSWTYGTNGIKVDKNRHWSVALTKRDEVAQDIQRAKAVGVDLIVAMPHIGVEYSRAPCADVQKFVRYLQDLGVNIVIASHPHIVQQFELEDGKFVAWSMGNFISSQRTKPRDVGVIAEIDLEEEAGKTKISEVRVTPTWVQVRKSNGSRTSRVLAIHEAMRQPKAYQLRSSDLLRLEVAQKDFEKNVLGGNKLFCKEKLCYVIK